MAWLRTGLAFREVQIAEGSCYMGVCSSGWQSQCCCLCTVPLRFPLRGRHWDARIYRQSTGSCPDSWLTCMFSLPGILTFTMQHGSCRTRPLRLVNLQKISVTSTAWSSMSTSLLVVPTHWTSSCLTFPATLLSLATHHWVPQTTSACLP